MTRKKLPVVRGNKKRSIFFIIVYERNEVEMKIYFKLMSDLEKSFKNHDFPQIWRQWEATNLYKY